MRRTFKYRLYPTHQQQEKLPATPDASFAVLSDGTEIPNPRLFQQLQKRLGRAQSRVAGRQKFSSRWKKAVRLVARIHRAIFSQRNDFQHELSRSIVNQYGTIVAEDLNVKGLSRGMLVKYVHDAGWAAFFSKLLYKAASQRCPRGEPNLKLLSDRERVCMACGLATSHDHASEMEFLRLGLGLQASTERQVACVA
jgi:putative transposase